MVLIDTHCHLDVDAFDPDRGDVIAAARSAGVGAMVVPGIDAEGWAALLALCSSHADLYPALGLHPVFLQRHRDSDLAELERLIDETQPVAVGEIGLDFFRRDLDREGQQVLQRGSGLRFEVVSSQTPPCDGEDVRRDQA